MFYLSLLFISVPQGAWRFGSDWYWIGTVTEQALKLVCNITSVPTDIPAVKGWVHACSSAY